MKIVVFILSIIVSFSTLCQDTTYLEYRSKNNFIYLEDESIDQNDNFYFIDPILSSGRFSDGYYIFFDSTSTNKIRLSGQILKMKPYGVWRHKNIEGILKMEKIFSNDTSIGFTLQLEYDTFGRVTKISKKGDQGTLEIKLNDNGVKQYFEKSNNIDDTSQSLSLLFDSSGVITQEFKRINERNHGDQIVRYSNGALLWKKVYDNGVKIGRWEYGLDDGEIWCVEQYNNDKLKQIIFNNGQSYELNDTEQQIVDYYSNGNKKVSGFVKNGIKVGEWCFYDNEGRLIGKTFHDREGNCTGFEGQMSGKPYF